MKCKQRRLKQIVAVFKQAGFGLPMADLIRPALAMQKKLVAQLSIGVRTRVRNHRAIRTVARNVAAMHKTAYMFVFQPGGTDALACDSLESVASRSGFAGTAVNSDQQISRIQRRAHCACECDNMNGLHFVLALLHLDIRLSAIRARAQVAFDDLINCT